MRQLDRSLSEETTVTSTGNGAVPSSSWSCSECGGSSLQSSQAKQCKWCGRHDTFKNPLNYQVQIKPTLPWRRPRGSECNHCPYAMETDEDTAGPENRAMLLKMLTTGSPEEKAQAREMILKVVTKWEKQKNDNNGGHIKSVQPKRNCKLSGMKAAAHETREFQGYLWTPAVYKRETGNILPKKGQVKVEHQGKEVKGLIRTEGQNHGIASMFIDVH